MGPEDYITRLEHQMKPHALHKYRQATYQAGERRKDAITKAFGKYCTGATDEQFSYQPAKDIAWANYALEVMPMLISSINAEKLELAESAQ
jgi:hypothetical protein